jgi:HlyD family secretion protein
VQDTTSMNAQLDRKDPASDHKQEEPGAKSRDKSRSVPRDGSKGDQVAGKEKDRTQHGTADAGAPASHWTTRRRLAIVAAMAALMAVGGAAWWFTHRSSAPTELALHGNVDLRQVALPFNNNERIAAVLVQEGDNVKKGELLARLDTGRLEPQVAQVAAQVAAQRAVVDRLHHGSRPEEIAEARANLESAKADAFNARRQFERKSALLSKDVASQQDADAAKAAAGVADARVDLNQKALDLALAGPRQEDIDQAEAQLRGNEAQLAYLRQQLADAELRAPLDAIVHSRLMEPGEMSSPQRPVFSLAIIDPKWVRSYVSERDLGKIRSGMQALVTVDSFPGRQFEGWIGFVSPVAEFTPKAVETEELRTSLLYEVRIFVTDPDNDLPLGMPATVHLPGVSASSRTAMR